MNKLRLQLSLIQQVGLLSLVVIVAIGLGLAYLLQQRLTETALEQEANGVVDQVEFVIAPNLVASDFDGFSPDRLVMFDAMIRSRIISTHIVRIKIWNKDGMLVYSDEKDLIGQKFPLSEELDEAFSGKIAMDVSALTKSENASERGIGPRLFEIYVPIRPHDSANILGAYEIYHDLDVLQPQIDSVQRLVYITLGVGFVVLYVVLLVIVGGASRELVRRNRENRELLQVEQKRSRQMQAINEAGRQLSAVLDLNQLLDDILRLIIERFHYSHATILLVQKDKIIPIRMRGMTNEMWDYAQGVFRAIVGNAGLIGEAAGTGRSVMIGDASIDSRWQFLGKQDSTRAVIAIPMTTRGKVNGVIVVGSDKPNAFEVSDISVLELIGAQSAIAVENAQLYDAARKNLRKLDALRTIDHAISATLELERTLGILIERAIEHLGQSNAAGFVALVEAETQNLKLAAVKNLSQDFVDSFKLQAGESIAGRVVEDGIPRVVTNLATDPRTKFHELRVQEGIESLIAVPMRVEGNVIGTLVIYTRKQHEFTDEETDFFVTLGGQAAIAVQNAQLYERTKSQATSLAQLATQLQDSYLETLTAMSAALDLRDRETEGHSQRVSEMTVELARTLGITDAQAIRNVRYGSILHDIGKIGISDNILLKPGSLSTVEWIEMRKHPGLGAAMLRDVKFLEDAIPIVLYHQERWNGSGYPLGLKGEEIPLAARIFAVVDVFDALTSARPYRKPMAQSQALDYIQSQSGILFDPQVVEAFVRNLVQKS
jgi:putative nucleotidyltransferase with HDIG domain